jgi:penicillin-binding protein 2
MSELKNPERELHLFRRRLALAGGAVVLAFMVLLGRFVYLQVAMQSHYATLAESNRISIVPAVPNRGVITDRNGIVLAQSYSAYTLEVTPSKVKNLEDTIEQLSTLVEITPRDRKRFRKLLDESKNFESMPLRTRLTDEEVARFAVNRYRFPGVEIKARLFRQYPFGELASHVIGYIGRINEDDLQRIERREETANYKGSDYIGKVGIELSYESELHGTTGLEEVEVDAGGRAVRLVSRTPPISGNNLQLSLDIRLQQIAEHAFGDKRGALVALDPNSGEVLAFVSKPGYDPNLFVEGIDPQNWDALNTSPDKPLLNRPLRGAYPPGSTFKPFMALAALTLGKRTPQQSISDPGYFMLGRRASVQRRQEGRARTCRHVQVDRRVLRYLLLPARQRARHRRPGRRAEAVRLRPEIGDRHRRRADGVLPSRDWKRHRFAGKQYREEHRKWYLGDNISVGIGQGYNAYTPLQLAHAVSTDRDQRRRVQAAHGEVDPQHAHRRGNQCRRCRDAHDPDEAGALGSREERADRRQQGRHRGACVCRRRLRQRRQDRDRAGLQPERREIRREEGWRSLPRPCVVHRVRTGRQAEDCDRGAGGERRLRSPGGGADRAPGVRLRADRQDDQGRGARHTSRAGQRRR